MERLCRGKRARNNGETGNTKNERRTPGIIAQKAKIKGEKAIINEGPMPVKNGSKVCIGCFKTNDIMKAKNNEENKG